MVIEWADWSEAEAAARWDTALTALPDYNLYQSYAWGEFKRRHGWSVRRGSILVDGSPMSMAQCLVREIRPLLTVLIWVPGGATGRLSEWLELGDLLQKRYRGWHFYLRANIVHEEGSEDTAKLRESGWRPADAWAGFPITFYLNLSQDETVRRQALTANWRHNLNRAENRGTVVEVLDKDEPLESVYRLYRSVTDLKGIAPASTLDDLKALREILGSSFTLGVARSEEGKHSALRAFARVGRRAQELIAGVSAEGRRTYTGYFLMWRLLQLARNQGVVLYDLSGADPKHAPGVYNFKKGIGGRMVNLLGEWEWTDTRTVRWAVNLGVRLRHLRIAR